jgi:hypothetical protein
MYHEKIALRILKRMNALVQAPSKIWANGYSLCFRWDGVGKINNYGLILVEVEPANPNEDHIRLHMINFILSSHLNPDIKKLIWVVYADGPRCHETLSSQLKIWKKFLSKIVVKEIPPMEILDRTGKLLERIC